MFLPKPKLAWPDENERCLSCELHVQACLCSRHIEVQNLLVLSSDFLVVSHRIRFQTDAIFGKLSSKQEKNRPPAVCLCICLECCLTQILYLVLVPSS